MERSGKMEKDPSFGSSRLFVPRFLPDTRKYSSPCFSRGPLIGEEEIGLTGTRNERRGGEEGRERERPLSKEISRRGWPLTMGSMINVRSEERCWTGITS